MYGCVFNEDMMLVSRLCLDQMVMDIKRSDVGRPPVAVVPMCREILLLVGEIEPGQEV